MSALLWSIAIIAGCVVAWRALRLRGIAEVACGYKAKVLCTAVFASGREMAPRTADEIAADSYWLLRPLRATVDRARSAVIVSLLGVRRTALHRRGLGATLTYPGASVEGTTPPDTDRVLPTAVWPRRPHHDGVQRIVDAAFEEPNAARLRRTHAVVVVHDGAIVAERYARGVGAATPLPGWSMAKSVLNALIGMLIDEGRLTLNQR